MKTKERKQIDYWEVVNIDKESNEITMLDYLFDHGDGFKGATGSKFEPISKERYNEILDMDEDEIAEHLIDSGFELPDHHKKGGYIEWAEQFTNEDKLSLFIDSSYHEHYDKIREHGYTEDEYPVFNCVGGGRCFDNKFKGNVNPELSKLIRKYETKS